MDLNEQVSAKQAFHMSTLLVDGMSHVGQLTIQRWRFRVVCLHLRLPRSQICNLHGGQRTARSNRGATNRPVWTATPTAVPVSRYRLRCYFHTGTTSTATVLVPSYHLVLPYRYYRTTTTVLLLVPSYHLVLPYRYYRTTTTVLLPYRYYCRTGTTTVLPYYRTYYYRTGWYLRHRPPALAPVL